MTNYDKGADDIAHERFRGDFDKLFGVRLKLRKIEPDRATKRRDDMRAFREACARMDARTDLFAKVMRDRDALQEQAAALVGQVADLQSALHALKNGRARFCETRPTAIDPPDSISELVKGLEAVVDSFKDLPKLMAMARQGGGAAACEKLAQSGAAALADLPSFTKH